MIIYSSYEGMDIMFSGICTLGGTANWGPGPAN